MKFDGTYILSQIITVIYYAFLCSTFLMRSRKKVLLSNFMAHIGQTAAMGLLGGFTGATMAGIQAGRDIAFFAREDDYSKEKAAKIDNVILVVTVLAILLCTMITYSGPLSLLSVVATLLGTFSVYQKNVVRYKIIGMIVGLLWLAYDIYIKTIAGTIFEAILVGFSIYGFIKDLRMQKLHQNRA